MLNLLVDSNVCATLDVKYPNTNVPADMRDDDSSSSLARKSIPERWKLLDRILNYYFVPSRF